MTERMMLLQRGTNIYKQFGIALTNSECRDISPYNGKIKKIKIFRLIRIISTILIMNLVKHRYKNTALLKVLMWRLHEAWTGKVISKKLKKMKEPF